MTIGIQSAMTIGNRQFQSAIDHQRNRQSAIDNQQF